MLISSGAKTTVDVVQFRSLNKSVILRTLLDEDKPKNPPKNSKSTYNNRKNTVRILMKQFSIADLYLQHRRWTANQDFQPTTHKHPLK